jgi:hypothetical protein
MPPWSSHRTLIDAAVVTALRTLIDAATTIALTLARNTHSPPSVPPPPFAAAMGEFVNAVAVVALAPLVWLAMVVTLLVDGVRRLVAPTPKRPPPSSVLITGATSGIGEGLALRYAGPGVHLALTGRNGEALARVAAACTSKGATVSTHRGDVVEREALGRWIEEVDAAHPLDLVVANAGVTESTTNTHHDLEAAARTLTDTNLVGVYNTVFPALKGASQGGGMGGGPLQCSPRIDWTPQCSMWVLRWQHGATRSPQGAQGWLPTWNLSLTTWATQAPTACTLRLRH